MIDNLLSTLLDLKIRYISIKETVKVWYRNKNTNYRMYSLNEVRNKFKKSETVFILGGSESINDVTEKQWNYIAKHDSFGMNWWPVHEFVPTYYQTAFPVDPNFRKRLEDAISKRKKDYNDTIFFLSDRVIKRGMHPRLLKEFFSENPLCCSYKYPERILIKDRNYFIKEDFKRGIVYRGHLNVILYLLMELGYKNIVLIGIDLINAVHFYDHYPSMEWQFIEEYSKPVEEKRKEIHLTATFSKGKMPVDRYIYALNDYVLKPNNINLYVGSNKSKLYPKIDFYSFK
ncbi:MAG: hypothetical protein KKH98_09340 [Spirochaetes bacterium]|nr:hypothetical protein [Spirochaetota bacterium]